MGSSIQEKDSISSSLFDVDDKSLAIPLDEDSAGIVEERKEKFYGFKLGNIRLLIDRNVHSEVVENANIMPIPLMPQHVLGLCNVRGNLVPIYNLSSRLEISTDKQNQNSKRVLILGENEDMVGMQIDEMLVSLIFEEFDHIENVPAVHNQLDGHTTNCYKKDGKYWFGFNYITLFESL